PSPSPAAPGGSRNANRGPGSPRPPVAYGRISVLQRVPRVAGGVLHVLTRLLEPTGHPVARALGLQALVVGLVADPLLGPALELLGFVGRLVGVPHQVLLQFVCRRWFPVAAR